MIFKKLSRSECSMESKEKRFKGMYFLKYIVSWMVFGSIFEILGLNFNMGIAVAVCMLLFDEKFKGKL